MAAIDLNQIRQQLNMPNLTDAAIRDVLKSKGITTQEAAQQWAQQNAAPAQQGFFGKGLGALEQHWAKSEKPVTGFVDWLTSSMRKTDPTAKKPAAAAPTTTGGLTPQEIQAREVANSPWTLAGNALAGSFTNAANQYSSLTSGQALPGIDQTTIANAEALAGTPSTSNAGQWLSAQSAAAQAAAAPVSAAMQQTQNAYTTGENAFSQALQQQGQANALAVETAPMAAWQQALASHITSTVGYTGQVPQSAAPTFKEYPLLSQEYSAAGIPVSFSNQASASGIPVGAPLTNTTGTVVQPTTIAAPGTNTSPAA